jgi:diguanylate cyclase (GGDEF)-like protein/PAS domain S-box-containing protein
VHYVIGGHAWTAHFASSRSFEHETASLQPALIALAGTSADLLLFFALYSISRNHRKLKQSHAELVVSQEALARERGRYERLVENVPGLVYRCATTEPWTALFVSQRVIELSGVPAAEFMEGRRGFGDFIHPDDKDSVAESIRTATVAGKPYEIEFRFGKTDGTWLWVVSRGQAQYGDTGEPLWLDGVTFDITESRRQQQEIVERELRYRAVIEAATDGFWLVDREGNLIGVNAAYCRMSGYSESELLGHKIQDLELERGGLEDRLAKVESHGHDRYEALHRRKDGTTWPAEVTITVMPSASEVFFFIRDLTTIKAFEAERVRFEEQMRSLAFHDPLTRLPNRRLLSDRLKQALAASIRNGTHGALLFLDMDNFKHLNDSLGHEMGDLLLVEVAQRLKASVREADTVARFGGDEFVVMLPGLSVSGEESALHARSVGEKILAALNQPYQLDGHVYHSTPSIGVTLFLGKGDDVDAILKRADVAMYQSKAAGRNMLRFFDAGMEHLVGERELLNACLRGETRDNELVLHYQPVLDLSGMIVGVEALARWRHPERGLLLPAQFMMLVEDSGLAVLLGHRTLEKACRQLAAWAGNPNMSAVDMTVNIGLRHVGHPSFVEEVERALAASGADPRRLIFELGEALVLQDNVLPLDVIRQVRAMGIRISLDNFGTCYMSLATLITELSVDQLKLTMDGLPADRSDAVRSALLDALAVLGRLLDTVVVAKGVETEAQLDVLRSQGWKQVQGYLFGRPLPSDELEALWAKW